MATQVLRFETRATGQRALLEHYIGTRRPAHAKPRPSLPPVREIFHRWGSADSIKAKVGEAQKRHKSHKLRGKAPAPLVDVMIAGPPPYASRGAWARPKLEQWFLDAAGWVRDRVTAVGGQVVGAWIHEDERSPHLHICIIPSLPDGTLGWGKLQRAIGAKEAPVHDRVTKAEMSASMVQIQDAFHEAVSVKHGLGRGQKGSKRKHHRPQHDAPSPAIEAERQQEQAQARQVPGQAAAKQGSAQPERYRLPDSQVIARG